MAHFWNTIDDMNNDMKNMETFNQIKILTIYGKFNFSLPNTLTHLYCNNNQLLTLPELPNTLTHLLCHNNPFNLWTALINPIKIKTEYAEIIYEKLNMLNLKIKEIESELNKNIDEEMAYEEEDKLNKSEIDQYNQKMSELRKEIDKILNFELEIIL